MRGVSWHESLGDFSPPPFQDLRLLRLTHWNFLGEECRGQMVLAVGVAERVCEVFARMYAARFPIEKMRLIDDYAGSDQESMSDNNCSAFNCRTISGSTHVSKHALGLAIDINPVQNPYVSGDTVLPAAAGPYADRSRALPGMLQPNDAVVSAFAAAGWTWGGLWQDPRDYHHFEFLQEGHNS